VALASTLVIGGLAMTAALLIGLDGMLLGDWSYDPALDMPIGERRGPHDELPWFVDGWIGDTELHVLERVPGGFLVSYRDSIRTSSICSLDTATNCPVHVSFYDEFGDRLWTVRLDDHLSRPDHLRNVDVRLVDDALYFDEGCRSYASEAGGHCSALVALDPWSGHVLWRTRPLVSNEEMLVVGDHIVTGYGFTDEADFLYVVRRADGEVVEEVWVPKAPTSMTLITEPTYGDGLLEVTLYDDSVQHYTMRDWAGANPRLIKQ